MKLALFPTRPLSLLREDAHVVDADGKPAKAGREIVLARGLCRFELFRAPARLSQDDRDKAARLKAETDAPFRNAGSLILRTKDGAAIWYWDAAEVAALLSKPAEAEIRVVPETLYRGVGDGWRIIEVSDGFEAQYWQAGSLIASTWRRRPFTDAQWRTFALSVDQAETAAPPATPKPMNPPLAVSDAWRRLRIGAPWTWKRVEDIARTAIVCVSALAMFCVGYALHLDQLASADERAGAALHGQLLASNEARRARAQLEVVKAYEAGQPRINVLDVAAQVLEALRMFGVDATDWSASDRQIRVVAPYVRAQTPLRDILGELEKRSFHDPKLDFSEDGASMIITINVGSAAAPAAGQTP
ncbi:MAG: hypothetical protein QM759_05270 [Terricaulis sp.]